MINKIKKSWNFSQWHRPTHFLKDQFNFLTRSSVPGVCLLIMAAFALPQNIFSNSLGIPYDLKTFSFRSAILVCTIYSVNLILYAFYLFYLCIYELCIYELCIYWAIYKYINSYKYEKSFSQDDDDRIVHDNDNSKTWHV